MAKKTKKGKKLDPAKEAASLVRKALKANKQATKAARKEARLAGDDGGESSEEPADSADIDALLASFSRLDASSLTSSSAPCPPPAPRANCSLTSAAEQGGSRDTLLLFGGEYFDGKSNVCNSDLHAYHVPSRSFKVVRASPCPPPRCSHQAVAFNGGLYVFGGELATAEQYHHYADFWRLDLRSYRWEQVETVKGSQGPQARSGHRMCLWRGHLVLFGGFFESKTTTRWYNDVWTYSFSSSRWTNHPFSPLAQQPAPRSGCSLGCDPAGTCAFVAGGFTKLKNPAPGSCAESKTYSDAWRLDLAPILDGRGPVWERLAKKGAQPGPRSGASSCTWKSRLLVFAGVLDEEGDHHKVASVFYDELFGLDFEKRRWFQVRPEKGGGDAAAGGGDDAEVEVDMEEAPAATAGGGWTVDKLRRNVSTYVDAGGRVVTESGAAPRRKAAAEAPPQPPKAAEAGGESSGEEEEEKEEEEAKPPPAPPPPPPPSSSAFQPNHVSTTDSRGLPSAVARSTPLPRINAASCVRGNTMYVYGGLLEIGDREVTMDDFWCLDLARRRWECLFEGTMHLQVWKGEPGSDTESVVSEAPVLGGESEGEEEEEKEEEEGGFSSVRLGGGVEQVREEEEEGEEGGAVEAPAPGSGEPEKPNPGEGVKDYFARTRPYWEAKVGAVLMPKELKKQALAIATDAYRELGGTEDVKKKKKKKKEIEP
ncbi:hypothetical protein TeGR_g3627 [Tetraparma gracilis]|uniref:DUF4110 domain-containing protein n=1 Tax=Tetraparma gracilis TaxID=2962635 RepID=A0ABQ6MRM8_9STRA|nr:hypothetical protein TeGR_g3627 [Tetraparma gracilis]